jgi:hypothetical protein
VWCAVRENLTDTTGVMPVIPLTIDVSRSWARPVAWVAGWASLVLGSTPKLAHYCLN